MRSEQQKWITGLALATGVGLGLASLGARPAHADPSDLEITWQNDFEGTAASAWWPASAAGVETTSSQAHAGTRDGWAAGQSGWNAINAALLVNEGRPCHLEAWIRSSPDVTDGYIAVRSFAAGLPGLADHKLVGAGVAAPGHHGYYRETLDFVADAGSVLFYVGQWGNGRDSWVRVDDVTVTCALPTCTRRTCDDVGASCGTIDDRCGGVDDCGKCDHEDICHADHQCHHH
jgi:hypothetical protein